MVSNIFKTDQNRIIGYHQIFSNRFRAFSQISRVLISDLMCLGSQLELVFLSFASSTIAAKPWDGSETDELSLKRPPSFEMIYYVAHEIPECKENFRELLKFMKPTGSWKNTWWIIVTKNDETDEPIWHEWNTFIDGVWLKYHRYHGPAKVKALLSERSCASSLIPAMLASLEYITYRNSLVDCHF